MSETSGTSPLARYDYYKGPQRLGDLWSLRRDTSTLACLLSTHRLGWELRLMSGSRMLRTQVCRTEGEVRQTSDAWRAEALQKGFSGPPPES
jgi:hypothetical protein